MLLEFEFLFLRCELIVDVNIATLLKFYETWSFKGKKTRGFE